MDPDTPDGQTTFALRMVDIGVRLSFLAALQAMAMPFLPGTTFNRRGLFLLVAAVAALLAVLVRRARGATLVETAGGQRLLEGWAVGIIGLVTTAMLVTGRSDGEGHLYFHLVVIYFALVLRGAALVRVAVLAVTATVLLGMDAGVAVAALITRASVLALATYLAVLIRRALLERVAVTETAHRDADRRAKLLATVGSSSRAIASLQPHEMLEHLVAAGVRLGFEVGDVCRFSDDHRTYTVLAPVGLDDKVYPGVVHPTDKGMSALVLESRAAVVVEDYASHPRAVEELRDAGYRSVVGVPIWVHTRLDACLVVGTRARTEVPAEAVEALELLAALAGRALENAALYEAQQEEADRLARLTQLKSDFVSNVSHELRTPLSVISGIGETLEHRVDQLDGALARELIGRLNVNAASLNEILTRLLDFSRLEAGTLEVDAADVRLSDVTRAVLERMQPLLDQHDVDVDVDEDLPVRADPVFVERILENLVGNAAKHTPPGTTVRVLAHRVDDEVEVCVTDDGPGVAPEDLQHLTERFFRGGNPDTRERKGLGLGLALVQELLRLHGSQLKVAAGDTGGIAFRFRLPISTDVGGLTGQWDRELDPARTPRRAG